ncbi:MAG TPA: Holliday junction branch migration protein RuvA [Coriobacteriia bacterium]
MIAFLTGRMAGRTASSALIEVGGVGLRLIMSTSSLAALPADGDEVTVHTYLHVREDELTLYGFESEDERALFEALIGVTGVGPKLALAVLSWMRPDVLRTALARDDVALLSSVPGVGKKTAQRLLIDLKDKVGTPELGGSAGGASSRAVVEAREALLGMGFSPAEAAVALRDVAEGATTEQLLRSALKMLGGAR